MLTIERNFRIVPFKADKHPILELALKKPGGILIFRFS